VSKKNRSIPDDCEYVLGDLVRFTGYLFSPDFVYDADFGDELGIVVGLHMGYSPAVLYRIYWLKTGRITETVAGHIKLAYVRSD